MPRYTIPVTVVDDAGVSATGTLTLTVNTALAMASATLPDAEVGVAYSDDVSSLATGGKAPFKFSTTGALPPGLTLSDAGLLSGTPT